MLDILFLMHSVEAYAFWGLLIVGLTGFFIYAAVMDRKTGRHRKSKFKNRCKSEKTKYYD